MPSWDHPIALLLSATVTLAAAFPVARFFFDDFETFKSEFGLSRRWERELWLLGFVPCGPLIYVKIIGFLGVLGIVFFVVYSLCLRIAQP